MGNCRYLDVATMRDLPQPPGLNIPQDTVPLNISPWNQCFPDGLCRFYGGVSQAGQLDEWTFILQTPL